MRFDLTISALNIIAISFIISYQNELELPYLILETICSFSILAIIIYKRFKAKSNIPKNQLVLALLEILIWSTTQQSNKNLQAFQIQILIMFIGEQESLKYFDAIFTVSQILNIIDFKQEQIISMEIGISVCILIFSNWYHMRNCKYINKLDYKLQVKEQKSNLEVEQNSRLPISQYDNSHSMQNTKRQGSKIDQETADCSISKQLNEFKALFNNQKIIIIDKNLDVEEVNFEITSYFRSDHQNEDNIRDFFNLKATILFEKNSKSIKDLLEEIYVSIKQCVVIKVKKQVGCNFKNVYMIVFPLPSCSDTKLIIQFIDLKPKYIKLKEKQKQVLNDTFKSLSHELGTNLNSILTYSSIAINDQNLPQDIYENYLKPIQINSQQLNLIVSNIRDYNLIKMKQFDLKIEEFKIDTVINDINHLFSDILKEKNIRLNVQIPYNCKKIVCDSSRFSQVYFQILQNSIKYTRNEEICVKVQQIQEFIEIVISDGGEGINKEELRNLNKILNQSEFVRVSSKSVGIGMGLGISNEIVKQLNQNNSPIICQQKSVGVQFTFTIKNHSEELEDIGQQSQIEFMSSNSAIRVFSQNLYFEGLSKLELISSKNMPSILNFPANQSKKRITKTKIDGESQLYQINDEESFKIQRAPLFVTQPLNTILDCHMQSVCCSRVLLIDDEFFNIQCLKMLLKSYNTICDSAYNGKEALDKIEQKLLNPCKCCSNQHYALIFFDINMPIMDGYECVQIVKKWIQEEKIRKCWCV